MNAEIIIAQLVWALEDFILLLRWACPALMLSVMLLFITEDRR